MMLLYGLLRGISALLRRYAEWKHKRARSAYESAETVFRGLETDCKADEIALGRPIDYAAQLKLLKAYERREAAKARWVRAAKRMNRGKAVEGRVRSFSEMRLPYTFGLIDMAFLMRTLEHLGVLPNIEQSVLQTVYSMFMN